MPKVRNPYRFMCDDLRRAYLNRLIVKNKMFVEAYLIEEQGLSGGKIVQQHQEESQLAIDK